jgi:uncharacterized membrane protein YsdA (DUF1294 family)
MIYCITDAKKEQSRMTVLSRSKTMPVYVYIGIYLAVISLVAIILTAHDKRAARKGSQRISEATLLIVSAIGGSVAMLTMMRAIRHKTKHKRFMVGIPVIIVLQIAVAVLAWWFL